MTHSFPLDSPWPRSIAWGKGESLARMAAAGLPVPPGFHVTTHVIAASWTKPPG